MLLQTLVSRRGALLLLLSAAALVCGCSARQEAPPADPASWLLHLEYRDGGDAPLGFLLTFQEDGGVRFYSPRRKVYWATLSRSDEARLKTLLGSPAFQEGLRELAARGHRFGCCDERELGIYLEADVPVALLFGKESPPPAAVMELVRFVNEAGREYFGRRYQLALPIDEK